MIIVYSAGIDGGKRSNVFLNEILPFPVHTTYVEVFAGSAVVCMNKVPSRVEIINDINSRLINAWRGVCSDRRKFIDFCEHEYGLDSEELFLFCRNNIAEDKIEDAARFFFVNHHSFSQNNKDFHGLSFTGKNNWHNAFLNKLKEVDKIVSRFRNAIWICRDFRNVLKRCDKPDTVIYLDPPYFKGGHVYEAMDGRKEEESWTTKDFEDLRDILSKIENAKFVLSIDKDDYWLEKMPDLYVSEISRINSASFCVGGEKVRDIEYVIRNFDNKEVEHMKRIDVETKVSSDMEL